MNVHIQPCIHVYVCICMYYRTSFEESPEKASLKKKSYLFG